MKLRSQPWLVVMVCLLAALACTSNDTLFIKLTATPVPTITPTPLAETTVFQPGGSANIVGASYQIQMSGSAGLSTGGMNTTSCFPNTTITINSISKNTSDPKDTTIYYNVQCGPLAGWVPEYWLTPFKPNDNAVIKSPDGKGAILYSQADTTTQPASDKPCPDGTTVSIQSLSLNPNTTDPTADKNIYAQVNCGSDTGYVLTTDLSAAK